MTLSSNLLLPERHALRTALVLPAGIALVWAATYFGLWWGTIAVGLAAGVLIRRGWVAVIIAFMAGLAGWGGPLAWQSAQINEVHTASVVAGMMGLGSNGWTVIIVSIVLAGLLCATAAWLVVALRGLLRALSITFR
jgi:hypothetical protein